MVPSEIVVPPGLPLTGHYFSHGLPGNFGRALAEHFMNGLPWNFRLLSQFRENFHSIGDALPDIEDEFLLDEAARAARAVVFAAVTGVEHDGVEALLHERLVAARACDGKHGNERHRHAEN